MTKIIDKTIQLSRLTCKTFSFLVTICLIKEKQAKISIAKPVISNISQIVLDELKIPIIRYHFDIKTNDKGIPATKNRSAINRILYDKHEMFDISVFLISVIFVFSCIFDNIANKHTFIIPLDVIANIIPIITCFSVKNGKQNANKDVWANDKAIMKFNTFLVVMALRLKNMNPIPPNIFNAIFKYSLFMITALPNNFIINFAIKYG